MNEFVDKVAKAIEKALAKAERLDATSDRDVYRAIAIAAISAMKLTPKMFEAGMKVYSVSTIVVEVWDAMRDAALADD